MRRISIPLFTERARKVRVWAGRGAIALGLLLLGPGLARAQKLSPTADAPRWQDLEQFQETISREQFADLLAHVYAPNGAADGFIEVQPEAAVIKTTLTPPATWTLHFSATPKPAPRFWRTPAEMGPAKPGRPLEGVKIALDPGHLGGPWAKMEERFFQIGESKPVVEGDLTLRVAQMLVPRLEALGATVQLVRKSADPATPVRPDPQHHESEILFYRQSEIRWRAKLVNEQLKPDLTLCLHLNAEGWGDPMHPEFVPRNHLHVLLNGCYSADELRNDDVRYEMLCKLLSRCWPEELAAGTAMAAAMARETKLPAYSYTTPNAQLAGADGYLWARNLLANRLYRTPVIFFEPYVMNSEIIWERIQAGDYEGEIELGGVLYKSIFREYADAVADGVREYFLQARAAGSTAPKK